MDVFFDKLFPLLFWGIVAYFAYRYFRFHGMAGVLFGSKVDRTLGEVEISKKAGVSTVIKIHVLEDKRIAVEEFSKATFSVSVSGYTLDQAQAQKLASLLTRSTQ